MCTLLLQCDVLGCVCVHTHRQPQAGPEGAWRWRCSFQAWLRRAPERSPSLGAHAGSSALAGVSHQPSLAATRCTEPTASPAAWSNPADLTLPACHDPAHKRLTHLDPDDPAPPPLPGFFNVAEQPGDQHSPGDTPLDIAPTIWQSPFSLLSRPSHRGSPPPPALAPVSGPSPPLQFVNNDPFARARIAAVQSRVAAPVVSGPRAPPPTPVFSPFRDGTSTLADEPTCSLLVAIERVTCTTLTRASARGCKGKQSLRPGHSGETPLLFMTSSRDPCALSPKGLATPSRSILTLTPRSICSSGSLLPWNCHLTAPHEFARFQLTLCCTSCRLRTIAAVAQCWQGMGRGSNEYSQLEEGRSKLLLSLVPPGLEAAAEVQNFLALWEERRFEELLRRAEEHLLLNRRPGKKKQRDGLADASSQADRAPRTAAVGAYRMATTGLVSSMLSFEESEDLLWAKDLLPTFSLHAQDNCDRSWVLHLLHPTRTGTGPLRACITRPSPLLARLAHGRSTSLSTCLTGCTATRFTPPWLLSSAGSPLVRSLWPPSGSRARGSAGNARKTANRDPSRWVRSAKARQLANQHQVSIRAKALHMHQWRISLSGAWPEMLKIGMRSRWILNV